MRRPVVANSLGELPALFPAGREPNKPGASDRVARRRWLPSDRRPIPAADIAIAVAAGHRLPLSSPSLRKAASCRSTPAPRSSNPTTILPSLWLEDVDGPRALQWVDAQTAETLRRFGSERFARDRNVLTALFDRPDRIPGITRRGGAIYNYWQDAANPKGLSRDDPRVLPRCRSELGGATRSRRARQGGRRGLDSGWNR